MSSSNFKYNSDEDFDTSPRNQHDSNSHRLEEGSKNEPQNVKLLSKDKSDHSSKKNNQNSHRNKLIEQHTRLKTQLKQLASKMDEISEKQKERKKKKISLNPAEEDQRVQDLKKQLKQQQVRIQKNKAEIIKLKRNLDNKYDINKIVQKQNELKHLKKQLQVLEDQKQSLEKIRKTQDRAIRNGEDKETAQKISKMQQQLRELTHKTKKQVQSINQKQKQIRKLHEAYIVKQQKVRQIQVKAKQKKSNGEQINQYVIAQLQQEIKNLQGERLQVEKQGSERVRALQKQRKQLKQELQRKKLILDEKQKQLRLNQMKHKQIVRLINSNPQQISNELKEGKANEGKRVVAKKGREAPKIQDHDVIDDN